MGNCAGSTCTATSVDGGGTDGKACLIAKPKCNKMGGGVATVACAVSGVAADADRDAFQLKFKSAAATTACEKGTCAADKAQKRPRRGTKQIAARLEKNAKLFSLTQPKQKVAKVESQSLPVHPRPSLGPWPMPRRRKDFSPSQHRRLPIGPRCLKWMHRSSWRREIDAALMGMICTPPVE